MTPAMQSLVVQRFGVAGQEVWRAAQRRRRWRTRARRVLRFAWLPVLIAGAVVVLARWGVI